jgi:DMSO/TMAO reductase YedYZ molybdopterin-dependent catalytic subunit
MAVSSHAQTNSVVLKVTGTVDQPLSLTFSNLLAMPRIELKAEEKDGHEAIFQGVELFEILALAKPKLTEKCCGNAPNAVVIVKAADGYRAIFSLPEIDPKFSSRTILLADRREGEPLTAPQGPLWVIVPDDKVHARWVRQVTAIEVRIIGDGSTNSTNAITP